MQTSLRKNAVAQIIAAGLLLGMSSPAALAAEVITYGSLSDPGYDAVIWAIENNKVSDPNVSIKIDRVSSIPALIQASMSGQYNLVPQGVLALPQMRESGVPVRAINTILRYNPNGHSDDVWVLKDSPYKTLKDLKGKTIAVSSIEAQYVVSLRWAIAERYGMNADATGGDFRWVEMPASQLEAALQSGKVDAAGFANVAAYTVTKDGAYRSLIQGSKELETMFGGPFPSNLMLGYEPDLNKRPDAYAAAGQLFKASAAYASKNPDEVFSAVAPKYKMSKDDLVKWFTTFAQMPLAFNSTDRPVLAKAWATGVKYGQLKKAPANVDDLIFARAAQE